MEKPEFTLPPHRDGYFKALSVELDPELNCQAEILQTALKARDDARGTRDMPARKDLDPIRLGPSLLPHIMLIDIQHTPGIRFRYRLIGTHITTMLGRDSTGRFWDELYDPTVCEVVSTAARWVLENRRPVRSWGVAPVGPKDYLKWENVELPLSSDGKCIDKIMTVCAYD